MESSEGREPGAWRVASGPGGSGYKGALFLGGLARPGADFAEGLGVGRSAPPAGGEVLHPGPPWPTSNNGLVKNQEFRKMPETVYFPLGWVGEKATDG